MKSDITLFTTTYQQTQSNQAYYISCLHCVLPKDPFFRLYFIHIEQCWKQPTLHVMLKCLTGLVIVTGPLLLSKIIDEHTSFISSVESILILLTFGKLWLILILHSVDDHLVNSISLSILYRREDPYSPGPWYVQRTLLAISMLLAQMCANS